MLFNSYIFIFAFLPFTAAVCFLLSHFGQRRLAMGFVALASAGFYTWWNPPYILLIGATVGVNFLLARLIHRHRSFRLLAICVGTNLAVLGYFKYSNFFVDNLNSLLQQHWIWAKVILPLGISFHTFQQIEYLVSVYRGLPPERNFVRYSLFVLFFPQLIAGPIVLYHEVVHQFSRASAFCFRLGNLSSGLTLFTMGLAKKVLLADSFAGIASPFFLDAASPVPLTSPAAWIGCLAYSLQLYFDFSGYTDMALGLARMFGIRLPLNFNSPYKATSIIDFWRRWHMTLSRFLRDFLYIPLGGNRCGPVRRQVNLLATMLIGGLWHGASWNFVIWGGLHGLFLAVNHVWNQRTSRIPDAPFVRAIQTVSWPLTFLCVTLAWIFFRAPDFASALRILKALFNFHHLPSAVPWPSLIWVIAGLIIVFFLPNTQQIIGRAYAGFSVYRNSFTSLGRPWKWRPTIGWGLLFGTLFVVCLSAMSRASEFLYFKF